jgi:hypothetical protein
MAEPLFKAVKKGDLEALEEAISKGCLNRNDRSYLRLQLGWQG